MARDRSSDLQPEQSTADTDDIDRFFACSQDGLCVFKGAQGHDARKLMSGDRGHKGAGAIAENEFVVSDFSLIAQDGLLLLWQDLFNLQIGKKLNPVYLVPGLI